MKLIVKIFAIFMMIFSYSSFANPTMELYKSPSCGCCEEWGNIMEHKGYSINVHHQNDWSAVKKKFGMPANLSSCHSAVIDGYLIEGHVPETDIARLLKERPSNISGIAAPGMPQHSPGMIADGEEYKDFEVIAFDKDGKLTVYNSY